MLKKYSDINEKVKSQAYPIDSSISTDLDKIKKHFNDNVIKNYRNKVMILAYSSEMSKPSEGRYIFSSDDFTEQSKNLFNLAFTELKIQVEVKVNKNKENAEALKINDLETSSNEWEVKYNFYLYWKSIKDLKIDSLKIASYKTLDKMVFYIPENDDSKSIQKIGVSRFNLENTI